MTYVERSQRIVGGSGMKQRLAAWLREWADRIHPTTAPRYTSYSFTFEEGQGIKFRTDQRGCPLWYLGETDYARAHDEADTEHTVYLWSNVNAGIEPKFRRAGGGQS